MSFYLGAAELSFRRKTALWTSEQKVKIDRIAYKDFYNQPGAAHGSLPPPPTLDFDY